MTPTDNLEPITEEEVKEAIDGLLDKGLHSRLVLALGVEFVNFYARLLNGYREMKEELAEKEREIQTLKNVLSADNERSRRGI